MKQKLGEERGITLVALIITIIVLIILAAVTINAAFKSNFIEMATNGTANYANAQSYEQRMMDDLSDKLDGVIDKISKIQSGGSAEAELENFTKNPDAYKHPDQSETNKDRAIGTDGKPVNMNLWKYVIINEEQKEVAIGNTSGCLDNPGYWQRSDRKIRGSVPQYMKIDGKGGIYTVTYMGPTFNHSHSLVEAPEIPASVTKMMNTFASCTTLTTVPVIPSSVTTMGGTFSGCTSLTMVAAIPINVVNIRYAFEGCTSLVEAPEIPASVTNMDSTFSGCTSLTGNIKINSSNVTDVSGWTLNNPITIQVPAGSTTYEKINAEYGSNPNVTIETF